EGGCIPIAGVLGFMRQMRPTVLHLRDPRVRIIRMRPVVVRALVLAFPIDPRQVGTRRRPNARRLGKIRQKLLVALAAVSPYDAAQRRVRSSVVASTPIVLPFTKPAVLRHCNTQVKTARCVSRSIKRRVREMVEWSGGASSRPSPRKSRKAKESAARHAMPRSESIPSK